MPYEIDEIEPINLVDSQNEIEDELGLPQGDGFNALISMGKTIGDLTYTTRFSALDCIIDSTFESRVEELEFIVNVLAARIVELGKVNKKHGKDTNDLLNDHLTILKDIVNQRLSLDAKKVKH